MATACHTIASLVVNYAIRRQFAAVHYDDSDRTYCEQFPWFELKSKIAEKCDAAGLDFDHVSKCRDSVGSAVIDKVLNTCATG
jgi:hypothetical protein